MELHFHCRVSHKSAFTLGCALRRMRRRPTLRRLCGTGRDIFLVTIVVYGMQQTCTAERMQADARSPVPDDCYGLIAMGEKEKAAPGFLAECPAQSAPPLQVRSESYAPSAYWFGLTLLVSSFN
jgi:hypothetical protein